MDMTRGKKLLWSYSFNIGAALLSCSLILQQLAANKFSFSANIYFFVCFTVYYFCALFSPLLPCGKTFSIFITRIVIIFLICYPIAYDVLIPLIFGASLLIDIFLFSRLPTNRYLSLALAAMTGLLIIPHPRWDHQLPQSGWLEGICVLAVLVLLAVLLDFLKMQAIFRNRLQMDINTLTISLQRLTSANLNIQHQTSNIEKRSIDEERKRITRELHDLTGYTFTNILMLMESAIRKHGAENEELTHLLVLVRDQAQEGLRETRNVLYRLRKEELPIRGLMAINRMVRIFEEITGMTVTQTYTNISSSYTEEIDRFIYKFVQETLLNAFKHAHASQVDIHYYVLDSLLSISVQDNGQGTSVVHEGIGLSGIRERLEKLGGNLQTKHDLGGFTIIARLPLPPI